MQGTPMDGYQIRHCVRARRLRITVRPAGVVVVAPSGTRDAEIAAFVRDHTGCFEA
jgi:predicted metal-dependent hydrolase